MTTGEVQGPMELGVPRSESLGAGPDRGSLYVPPAPAAVGYEGQGGAGRLQGHGQESQPSQVEDSTWGNWREETVWWGRAGNSAHPAESCAALPLRTAAPCSAG